jgi:predicted PurR-regulated permease PerM
METKTTVPFYLKLCCIGILIYLVCVLILKAQDILIPLAFAILLSIALLPVNQFLEKEHCPRSIAIILSLGLSVVVIGAVIYFISTQIANFTTNIPEIKKNLHDHYLTLQQWIYAKFHFTIWQQKQYLKSATSNLNGSGYIGQTFLSVTGEIIVIILVPVYTFLILFYRNNIRAFFIAVFPERHKDKVNRTLNQTRGMIENYLLGLLIEMGFMAVLLWVGFLIIGLKFALFLAVLAAILNIIPYVGILIATVFTLLVSLGVSHNMSDLLWIVVIYILVHNIDTNVLKTLILGSKVRINAMFTVLGIIVGNALAGYSGMFLAVPAVATLKIIFDQVDELKPWGILLGGEAAAQKKTKIQHRVESLKKKSAPGKNRPQDSGS